MVILGGLDVVAYAFFVAVILQPREKPQEPPVIPAYASRIYCLDKVAEPKESVRGQYHVYYNYVPMNTTFNCWESVTYVTHAPDYTFLDNLVPIIERWRAPISIAIYAPGTDFKPTVDSIKYLRHCSTPLVIQFVTFHVYYSNQHVPEKIPERSEILPSAYDCSKDPPWKGVASAGTYKNKNNLAYPSNVGRNIAKESATTHYILVADIEMYPSENLVPEFLAMISKNEHPLLWTENPIGFVLPPFEVEENCMPPLNKRELFKLLNEQRAFPFHERIYNRQNAVPGIWMWMKTQQSDALRVSGSGKRTGDFKLWNPIYIGTKNDPKYEERISWDGMYNKGLQAFELCALNYEFLILNHAFMVHRPGISVTADERPQKEQIEEIKVVFHEILPGLRKKYPLAKQCEI